MPELVNPFEGLQQGFSNLQSSLANLPAYKHGGADPMVIGIQFGLGQIQLPAPGKRVRRAESRDGDEYADHKACLEKSHS
jgi:hypothetical protein